MKTLNVIGCGNVGKTLSRVWAQSGALQVRCILNRSLPSSSRAAEFVGSGRPVESYRQLESADIVMISVCDEAVEECCRQLCRAEVLKQGAVLFHCSGALPAELLAPARDHGARIAAVHPVKSFADPAAAARSFAGTYCAVEGDPRACDVLRELLRRSGAIPFDIDAKTKTIYHAATVIVCNYLVALVETGLRCFQQAGVPRETALRIIKPIVISTANNVFELGPVGALTGPIARGESSIVQRQVEALGRWDERIDGVYRGLGRVAVELSATAGRAGADALAAIEEILRR